MHNSLTYIFVHDFTNSLSSISTMSETNIIFRILFHSNGPYSTQTYFHAIFVLFGSADLGRAQVILQQIANQQSLRHVII